VKLEAGKQYQRRDGVVVAVSANPFQKYSLEYPFVADGETYTVDGKYRSTAKRKSAFDLVAEISEAPVPIIYPYYTSDDELAKLAQKIADNEALFRIATACYEKRGQWCNADNWSDSVRYLELRGLLERHPTEPGLVRVKE